MLNSRKLISGLILLIVGISITLKFGDIPNNLLNLMQLLYTSFVIGNAAQHYTTHKFMKDKEDEKISQ